MTLDQALQLLGLLTDTVTQLTAENAELRALVVELAPPLTSSPIATEP